MATIIGLSGHARAGKDTVAGFLVKNHHFKHKAFADPIRDMLEILDPIVGLDKSGEPMHLEDVLQKFHWTGYKETPYHQEIRRLLQLLGADIGRNAISENIWIDYTFRGMDSESKYAISDVRFPNEVETIHLFQGDVWRIERPGVNAVNSHESDSLFGIEYDYVLKNDGSLSDLEDAVDELYESRYGTIVT